MAYDENLAERIRSALAERNDTEERKMFGGLTFMVAGSMCCGIVHEDLMVRIGPDAQERALTRPHVRPMPAASGSDPDANRRMATGPSGV